MQLPSAERRLFDRVGALRGSGPLQYNQLRSPGRFSPSSPDRGSSYVRTWSGFVDSSLRCLRIAPPALRGTSGSATMTTPGGAGTTHPPVLGAPASLLGSELPSYRAPALCRG